MTLCKDKEVIVLNYNNLKLENQLCFPLYACSREVIKLYKPYLEQIDLTYTQYVVMMVLWDCKSITVKTLGERLHLDSGTLTPLLKRLEKGGLVSRDRSAEDERNLIVTLTDKGENLKEAAKDIPGKIGSCIKLSPEDAKNLYRILYQILECV